MLLSVGCPWCVEADLVLGRRPLLWGIRKTWLSRSCCRCGPGTTGKWTKTVPVRSVLGQDCVRGGGGSRRLGCRRTLRGRTRLGFLLSRLLGTASFPGLEVRAGPRLGARPGWNRRHGSGCMASSSCRSRRRTSSLGGATCVAGRRGSLRRGCCLCRGVTT